MTKIPLAASPRTFPRYWELEAVVRRLPILPEREVYFQGAVDILAVRGNLIAAGVHATYGGRANRDTTIKELEAFFVRTSELADRVATGQATDRCRDQLTKLMKSLHTPATRALTNVVFDRQPKEFNPSSWSTLHSGEPLTEQECCMWFEIGGDALNSIFNPAPTELEEDAALAKFRKRFSEAARIRIGVPADPVNFHNGRSPDRLTHTVVDEIAQFFALLTGKEPTLSQRPPTPDRAKLVAFKGKEKRPAPLPAGPGGPFFETARDVLSILKIEADPAKAARLAIERRKKKSDPSGHN